MGLRLRVDVLAVLGTTGITLIVMGVAQLLPAFAALLQRGQPALPLFVGAAGTGLAGMLLLPLRSRRRNWTRRESLAGVALSWFAAVAAAAVPYVALGTTGLVDALVESASGLTTTGATILPDVDAIPPPLHLWRALTHWLGGAGIVLIVVVLTPWLGGHEELRQAQRAETSFLTERYEGSTRTTLKGLLFVYVGATVLLTAILVGLGLGLWDALLHSFATISTGGFSTRTASAGAWGPAVQMVLTAFMLLGALNFAVLGRAITGGGWRAIVRSPEVRLYLVFVLAVSLVMSGLLFTADDPALAARYSEQGISGLGQAWVDASFTTAAISTTTGFCTENYAAWPAACQVILLFLMLVGGCSGSTAGGLKFRRLLIVCKDALRQLRLLANPRAEIPLRLGAGVVSDEEVASAHAYLVTYGLLVLLLAACIALTGSDPVSAGAASVSSFGSIGPGFGDCDPTGSFQPYAGSAKLLCVFAMILGRLEVFPVLTVVLPSFWFRRARGPQG
jgi:trk system potassium uptake protein TrkH